MSSGIAATAGSATHVNATSIKPSRVFELTLVAARRQPQKRSEYERRDAGDDE